MEYKENRQYVMYMDALFDSQLGRISEEVAISQCEIAFCITRGEMAYERLEEVVLSRMEAMIIKVTNSHFKWGIYILVHYISICYKKTGQRKKAIAFKLRCKKGFNLGFFVVRFLPD